jgi:YidC/Oxa1 family membrane protein insertase
MFQWFHVIFYQPIFNVLIEIYNILPGHDIGVAIILLTVLIKLILWPINAKALHSQRALTELQPKIEEIKKQFADKKEEQAKAMMALYSAEKVSPMSSCLPLLIQLPVFIALYRALASGLKSNGFDALYPFVANPGKIEPTLFGVVGLAAPSIVFALLAGATQFVQARMMVSRLPKPKGVPGSGDEQMLATMNKQMTYMMPVMTVFIGWKLPAGVTLYWLVMNLLTAGQQWHFFSKRAKAAGEVEVISKK